MKALEPDKKVLDAFVLLMHAFNIDHTQMYKVLLNGESVTFGKIRLWRTQGAAKAAVNNAIFCVMWQYAYWSQHTSNQASRLTGMGITKEMLDDAFQALAPEYSELSYGNVSENQKKIKILTKVIVEKLIETGIIKIEKA